MDPELPVLAAVRRGMAAEGAGRAEEAQAAYDEAWSLAADDYERCVAAHYVPRLIEDPATKLHWNRVALQHADAVGDVRVAGFYASLHANIGYCLRGLNEPVAARQAYLQARSHLDDVEEGPYKTAVVAEIERSLAALPQPEPREDIP